MTGKRPSGPALHNSNYIPQFAPNFTVYLLPPNAVCLYSENRKLFLHGELYVALAAAIGEGGKSFRELVRSLEPQFSSDKVREALKRLVARRYVLRKSRASTGVGAAYWASLGLAPEAALKKSSEVSRPHPIDRCAGRKRASCRADRVGRSRRNALA